MLHISTPELNLWVVYAGDAYRGQILHLRLVDSAGEVYTYSKWSLPAPVRIESGTEKKYTLRARSTRRKRVALTVTLKRIGLDILEFRATCNGQTLVDEMCRCNECSPPPRMMTSPRYMKLYRWAVKHEVAQLAQRIEYLRQYEPIVTKTTATAVLDWLMMEAHIVDYMWKEYKHRVRVLRHHYLFDAVKTRT